MNFLAQLYDAAIEADIRNLIADLKFISAMVTVILLPIFAYYIYKLREVIRQDLLRHIEGEISPPLESVSAYDARWQEIKRHLQSANQAEWKLAVVEADNLADAVLKAADFKGDSMGERLISIEPVQMKNLDKLWRAHKIRNMLVHDTNFDLRRSTALEAIDGFEAAIRELGGID